MQKENSIDVQIGLLHAEARKMLAQNIPDETIISVLRQKGADDDYASLILENAKSDLRDRKQFWKQLIVGSFVTLGGGWLYYYYRLLGGAPISLLAVLFWVISTLGIVLLVKASILFRR